MHERLADAAVTLCDPDEPGRRPRALEDARDPRARERRQLRRLQDDGVPRRDRGRRLRERDPEREVPGRDQSDHTARLVDEPCALVQQVHAAEADALGREDARRLPCEPDERLGRDQQLGRERLDEGLRRLRDDGLGDLVHRVEEDVGRREHERPPLGERRLAPAFLGEPRLRDELLHGLGRRGRNGRNELERGRVDDAQVAFGDG